MHILPQAAAPDLTQPAIARAWDAARKFETMALNALLTPMMDSVDAAHGAFGGGEGEAAFRPMLTQELARAMADHGGIGLAQPVFQRILQLQEASQ
jgi:peptidoglycan hydrolase FlgJ